MSGLENEANLLKPETSSSCVSPARDWKVISMILCDTGKTQNWEGQTAV